MLCRHLLLFYFSKIIKNIANGLLIHRNALFEHVQSPWNNFKLWDNFFQRLSELLASARNSGFSLGWLITFLHSTLGGWLLILCCARDYLLSCRCFVNVCSLWSHLFFSVCGVNWLTNWFWNGCLFFLYWWRTIFRWENWSFTAKIINKFLFELIQVALPNHNYWIISWWSEIVSTGWEVNCICCTLVSIQSVQDMALAEIPNLYSTVTRAAD